VSGKEVFVKYVVTEDDFVLVNEARPTPHNLHPAPYTLHPTPYTPKLQKNEI